MLDLNAARASFPALRSDWALFDNAGGTVPARHVIERLTGYMERHAVQHGATYALSRDAVAAVDAGRRAAACLFNADPGEIVHGASTTVLVQRMACALGARFAPGDEVIVTNLDHEANIGPWRGLEERGVVVKEWRFRPETLALELEDLEPLLSDRTRLVAFTHCPNVTGTIHDVASIAARIREAGAWSFVDGVAFAPHRAVDVRALGVDFYVASLYKVYGPHQAMLFGRRELLEHAKGQNHFFFDEHDVPGKLEPGGVNHELVASLPGICEYLTSLDEGAQSPEPSAERLAGIFADVAAWESQLIAPLIDFLVEHPRVTLHGVPAADPARRVPTVAFSVDGMRSSELPPRLDERRLALRWGHFYAYRAIRDMGLMDRGGVIRASLVHYNSPAEVERLITALAELL
jgi:cysteine desulfurase family protein (TIGR01976 family)